MTRKTHFPIAMIIVVLLTAGYVAAQQPMMRKIEINDPGQSAMIHELGALLLMTDSVLQVTSIMDPSQRPDKYADVDLMIGDQVLMANGKRLANGTVLTEMLEAAEPGAIIKLGIKRDGQMRLVSFERGDPEDQPQQVMMMTMTSDSSGNVSRSVQMVGGPDNAEMEVVADLGLLISLSEEGVKVEDLMPELTDMANHLPVESGDIITHVNGKAVASPAEFMAEYDNISSGTMVELRFDRGDQTLLGKFPRP